MRSSWAALALAVLALTAGCKPKTGPVAPAELPRVLADLSSDTAATREAAKARLLQTPRTLAWPALERLFGPAAPVATKPAARVAALRIFSKTVGSEGLPIAALQSAIVDPDPSVRDAGIAAAVAWADPRYHGMFEELRDGTQDAGLKAALVAALPKLDANRRLWARQRADTAPNREVHTLALRSLGDWGTAEDVPWLIDRFKKEDDALPSQTIIQSLTKIGGADAKAFVLSQLDSEDPFIRSAAAISEWKTFLDPSGIPSLEKMVKTDVVGDNRVSALRALAALDSADSWKSLDAGCAVEQKPMVRTICGELLKAHKSPHARASVP